MDIKLKIASAASITSILIAAMALAIAPVGASYSYGGSDDFEAESEVETKVTSSNYAYVDTDVTNNAMSGGVEIEHNDGDVTGGASTGDSSNGSMVGIEGSQANTAAVPEMPAMDLSDAKNLKSWDDVELKSEVETTVNSSNTAYLYTTVGQTATSGSVDIHCNDGDVEGDISTGAASNESEVTIGFTQTN